MLAVAHRRTALACCAACAASVRPARLRADRAWMALLAAVAALIPIGAMSGPGDGDAGWAAPVPLAAMSAPPVGATAAGPLRIAWHQSRAVGAPSRGRLQGAVLLPADGPGFYTYDPNAQRRPGARERRWGTAALVRQAIAVAAWWAQTHPGAARLGFGDLSRRHGGPFPDRESHVSHQNGLDVDIRLPRRDRVEGRANQWTYDRWATQTLVNRLVRQGASLVLIGPNLDLRGPPGVVVRWPNHDDHLHVRFPDPDGTAN